METKTKAILKAKTQATALITPLDQQLEKAIFISDKYYNNSLIYCSGLFINIIVCFIACKFCKI